MNPEFQEANDRLELIPVMDRLTIDVVLDHVFRTFDEVTGPYRIQIFGLQQRLLVEDLTASEKIGVREQIARLTLGLEAITGSFATVAERIES